MLLCKEYVFPSREGGCCYARSMYLPLGRVGAVIQGVCMYVDAVMLKDVSPSREGGC